MKLIELLVQELPKRGGWNENWVVVTQDADGYFCCWRYDDPRYNGFGWRHRTGKGLVGYWRVDNDVVLSCDSTKAMVTRSQYESALAASQKPTWSCEGLPPVGAKVEFFINPKLGYRNAWIPDAGTEMEVVAHKTTTDGNDVAVCYWDEGGAGRSCCFVPESLKPLRTEAERKHEAVLESICAVLEMVAQDYKREDGAKLIYEAIAAGKIPGVKLDD